MTEDEAKKKWCPMIRMSPQSAINNRGENHPNAGNVNCIGSECMMWRWHDRPVTTMHGYCGLAGKS